MRAHVPDAGSGPVVLGVRVPHVRVPHRRLLPPPPQEKTLALVRKRDGVGGEWRRRVGEAEGYIADGRQGTPNPNALTGLAGPREPNSRAH
jgi:hypothetical protein